MNDTIRVLVIDDTATYRAILSGVITAIEGYKVVGIAANGKIGLDKVGLLKPDLVTLDMEMPVMGGLETLRNLSRDYPDIGVVMVSAADSHSADQTVEALSHGCLEFIVKPSTSDFIKAKENLARQFERLITLYREKRMSKPQSENRKGGSAVSRQVVTPLQRGSISLPQIVDLVAIGSSTGGPRALEEVIPKLPPTISVPVVIVQHMPPLFTRSLAKNLDAKSELTVLEGCDGDKLVAGSVYIAPGGRHMVVEKGGDGEPILRLNDDPPENSCRPAVDTLFTSIHKAYLPQKTLCVILTGMGADGVNGVRALQEKQGGYCITQSEKSCVVYGMPRSVAEAGLVHEPLDLKDIPGRITEICTFGKRRQSCG
ncbi:MAG: chemotaxis-specific protein-glutamate methyltransferase CheB [Deltaproteobacteria bacterium]|nr:chemotaxis-specific protein-glutamate methyltransferase CheB [Deltaproteobacteria bacterium]